LTEPALPQRAIGWLSRRLDRPELLAAFQAGARQGYRDELAMRAVLASTLRSDSTYVDVGTNRGQVLSEAVRTAPNGRHIAFEPIPTLAAEVSAHFPNVECRCLAVGAAAGTAEFWHFRKLDGWSGLRRAPGVSDEQGDPEAIDVQISTLDAELEGWHPAVVKIDVEGAELGVLQGARRVLGRSRPTIVLEHAAAAAALYESTSGAVWDILAEFDYEILDVTGGAPVARAAFGADATVINWLARPRSQTAA
jgi:FkbM family methyltransferase